MEAAASGARTALHDLDILLGIQHWLLFAPVRRMRLGLRAVVRLSRDGLDHTGILPALVLRVAVRREGSHSLHAATVPSRQRATDFQEISVTLMRTNRRTAHRINNDENNACVWQAQASVNDVPTDFFLHFCIFIILVFCFCVLFLTLYDVIDF